MVTKKIGDKVKREVQEAFRLLAKSQGIKVSQADLPKVEVREPKDSTENPHYITKTNTVLILPQRIGHGDAYFEEASHALRNLVEKKQGMKPTNIHVHEFYGRIGETLGRELTKGTPMEYLFKGKPVRDFTNPAGYLQNLTQNINNSKLFQQKVEDADKIEAERKKSLGKDYQVLEKAFNQYEQGKIDYDALKSVVNKMHSSQMSLLKKRKKVSKSEISVYEDYFGKVYAPLKGTFNIIDSEASFDDKTKKELALRAINEARHYYSNFEKSPSLSSLQRGLVVDNSKIAAVSRLRSHETHFEPYKHAEKYSAEELLGQKGLYEMPDEEVRAKYFGERESHKPKKSKLEKLSAPAIIFAFAIAVFYLTISNSMTGLAVLEQTKVVFGGSVFISVLFFLCVFFFEFYRELQ